MPHQRSRHLFPILLKRRKLWPVVGVIGARQVGKSTLLREFLSHKLNAKYFSLDKSETRKRMKRALRHFLEVETEEMRIPIILDEAQKIPDLFDEIKALIDVRRIPGRFFLSGSTEFSIKTGIRESLTGRIGINHLYPLILSEIDERPFVSPWVSFQVRRLSTASSVENYLQRGGMPGICFLRDAAERSQAFESWIDTTCFRDLQNMHGAKLDGEIAKDILLALPTAVQPTIPVVAKLLKQDARIILKHIDALKALLVLNKVSPHPAGKGKPHYLIFDCGLASHLGATRRNALRIWAFNECSAQYEYSGLPRPRIYYYESSKHSFIDMVISERGGERGILLDEGTDLHPYLLRTMEAFLKRVPTAKMAAVLPISEPGRESRQIQLLPWSGMC